jgi:formylglycine-generating enzyme required for sulfatase activity
MDQYYNDNADIFPVMQVSWNDAVAYTKWLSEKTNKIYRLPYEFEWEIFAQYGEYQSVINIFESNDIKYGDNESFLHQLAERIINSKFQFGILWEWIQDWYSGYDKLIKNKDFGKIYKILRGGSLLSDNYQRTK